MTELQFLDADAINALLTVLTLKPDKVIYFFDPMDISDSCRARVIATVKSHLPSVETEFITVDRLDMDDVRSRFFNALKTIPKGEDVVADITGGTEIMAGCFLSTCYEMKIRAVYAKLQDRMIYDFATGAPVKPTVSLTLSDYLSVIGASEQKRSRITPKKKDFARIKKAAEYVFDHVDTWYGLYTELSRRVKRFGASTDGFVIPKRLIASAGNRKFPETPEMLEMFAGCGFLKETEDGYVFATRADRERMTTFGIWLELYVYILALEFFDEVYVGFRIDWDDEDGEETYDNEIDVVAMKDSIPYFISCKMKTGEKTPSLPELYEVAYLAYRFGGDNCKGILVSNAVFRGDASVRTNSIYNRFKKLRIGRIEVADFRKCSARDLFERAVRMTERGA